MERTTFTVLEVAGYIGVSRDFVYSLVARNEIPHIRIGSRIVFKRTSIDSWMNAIEKGGSSNEIAQ